VNQQINHGDMTESCPHQRKIFHSPLADHFSPVMQSSESVPPEMILQSLFLQKASIAFLTAEILGFPFNRCLIGLAERQKGMTAGVLDEIFRYGRSLAVRYRFGRFRG
jgi:hypothetical protein